MQNRTSVKEKYNTGFKLLGMFTGKLVRLENEIKSIRRQHEQIVMESQKNLKLTKL